MPNRWRFGVVFEDGATLRASARDYERATYIVGLIVRGGQEPWAFIEEEQRFLRSIGALP